MFSGSPVSGGFNISDAPLELTILLLNEFSEDITVLSILSRLDPFCRGGGGGGAFDRF